jgi:hypothetical protein
MAYDMNPLTSEHRRNSRPSIGSLVAGILSDARDLFAQELKLAKKEISEDIQKTKSAATALAVGLGILAISVGLLLLMLVHLIHETTALPLWGSYGIVGVVVGIVGAVLLFMGKNKVQEVDFKPEQTAKAVKEDVGWIKARMRVGGTAKEHEPL